MQAATCTVKACLRTTFLASGYNDMQKVSAAAHWVLGFQKGVGYETNNNITKDSLSIQPPNAAGSTPTSGPITMQADSALCVLAPPLEQLDSQVCCTAASPSAFDVWRAAVLSDADQHTRRVQTHQSVGLATHMYGWAASGCWCCLMYTRGLYVELTPCTKVVQWLRCYKQLPIHCNTAMCALPHHVQQLCQRLDCCDLIIRFSCLQLKLQACGSKPQQFEYKEGQIKLQGEPLIATYRCGLLTLALQQ